MKSADLASLPTASNSITDNSNPQYATPKPIVVLIEQNPWLDVIGSDSPTFAYYDNGLVIFQTNSIEDGTAYLSANLNDKERKELENTLGIGDSFFALDEDYTIAVATDQPTNTIHAWRDDRHKTVSVYSSLRGYPDRREAPKVFVDLFDQLTSYRHESASAWLPEKIEVMIWPYDYSPEKPLEWPAGWPGLNHPTTKAWGESRSIYLGAEKLRDLNDLLNSRGEKQAIQIDSKKWAVSYRLPFPNERLWMKSSR